MNLGPALIHQPFRAWSRRWSFRQLPGVVAMTARRQPYTIMGWDPAHPDGDHTVVTLISQDATHFVVELPTPGTTCTAHRGGICLCARCRAFRDSTARLRERLIAEHGADSPLMGLWERMRRWRR